MPSKKGLDQALTWLKSKMAEWDTLDAINAEVCYNVIMDLKERKKAIGALYHLTKEQNKKLLAKQEDWKDHLDEYERLGYTRIQMNEQDLADIFDRGDEC